MFHVFLRTDFESHRASHRQSSRIHAFINSFASLSRAFPSSSPPPIVSSVSVSTHHKNGDTDIVANGVVRFPRFPEFPLPPPDFVDMSSFRFVSSPRARDEHARDRVSRLVRVSRSLAFADARTIERVSVASRWRLARWRLARAGTRGEK
jgi:hypothetical protein